MTNVFTQGNFSSNPLISNLICSLDADSFLNIVCSADYGTSSVEPENNSLLPMGSEESVMTTSNSPSCFLMNSLPHPT